MTHPLTLEIKGNSLDDGPGLRSVVFFKGCPLDCIWCHNPESKSIHVELSFAESECIKCGECQQNCSSQAIDLKSENIVNRNKCTLCFKCVETCPAKALTQVGSNMNVEEITEVLLKDKAFYDVSGGGVTVSGGEPGLFPEFVGNLLKNLHDNKIHTLMETCGYFDFEQVNRHILPYVDMIYFDLKIYDTNLHRKYCGVPNEKIIDNFKKVFQVAKSKGISLLPRTPLIPDITDTDENMAALSKLEQSIGVEETQLLPYNPLWEEKTKKLGHKSENEVLKGKTWQCLEKLCCCKDFFQKCGICTRK